VSETEAERSKRLLDEAWRIKDLERWGFVHKGTTDEFIRRWFIAPPKPTNEQGAAIGGGGEGGE
jgi:hypothetical protein